MSRDRKYRFNRETLNYEQHKTPLSAKFFKTVLGVIGSFLAFGFYFFLYTYVFGLETPKHLILRKQSDELHSRLELLKTRYEKSGDILDELQIRDDMVYRSIFGMEEISSDIRNAGYGGTERFSTLKDRDFSGVLTSTAQRINILYKKAYVQSKSLDDVTILSQKAGEMALSIPTILPVIRENVRYSSPFGYRIDPIDHRTHRMHSGMDMSGISGEPVFVTGNGVVKKVGYDFFGYGNFIVVDHGFGYKTRYAHLKGMLVAEGQKVVRGEQIGEMGNSGRSSGTHLHYEVIFRDHPVNPIYYFNNDISSEDYASIIKPRSNSHI